MVWQGEEERKRERDWLRVTERERKQGERRRKNCYTFQCFTLIAVKRFSYWTVLNAMNFLFFPVDLSLSQSLALCHPDFQFYIGPKMVQVLNCVLFGFKTVVLRFLFRVCVCDINSVIQPVHISYCYSYYLVSLDVWHHNLRALFQLCRFFSALVFQLFFRCCCCCRITVIWLSDLAMTSKNTQQQANKRSQIFHLCFFDTGH